MNIHPVAIIGAIAAFVVVMIVVGRYAAKKRREAITAAVGALGGSINFEPDEPTRQGIAAALPLIARLGPGARGVRAIARVPVDGRDILLVHHRYTTGSGKSQTTHHATIAGVPAPAAWPRLTLGQESALHKLADWLGYKDLELEDPAFNKAFRVKCEDEEFAILALSPDVQGWLLEHGRGMAWSIGQGAIAARTSKEMQAGDLKPMATAVAELSRRLPPELQHYVTPPTQARGSGSAQNNAPG